MTCSRLLTINAGSSSLKFALFGADDPPRKLASGKIERIGLPEGRLFLSDHHESQPVDVPNHGEAAKKLIHWLETRGHLQSLDAVGHRLVHGGVFFRGPVQITTEVLNDLRRLNALDPDHLPAEIAIIEAFREIDPDLPQVACFDTAFHQGLPRIAQIVPIPRRYEGLGVRRYGFHGLSYEYLMEELRRLDNSAAIGRVVLAHLGSGASLAAVHEGKCVDTTMGFTPTSGLVMGTRSGDLDPSVAWFLHQNEGMTADAFHRMANQESGLIGVSETSSDVRDLLAREKDDIRAAEAIALFCQSVKKAIGALAAVLGGIDTLVFAGGIGENAPEIRRRVCEDLSFLGITFHPEKNAVNASIISTDGARTTVRIIRTDEESILAGHTARLMNSH